MSQDLQKTMKALRILRLSLMEEQMNKVQFKERFEELIKTLEPYIKKKAKELIDLRAVDLKTYGDDHRLPRIILQAVLKDAAEHFRPPHPLDAKEAQNLLYKLMSTDVGVVSGK